MDEEIFCDIANASGSRSPNGQHIWSTHIGGVPLWTPEGLWNPTLPIVVMEAGSMLRYPNGAWQAAGWQVRVTGVAPDAPVTNARVRR